MENAANSLIIAAGILIGILILSLTVYLFIDFGSTSASINKENAQKQITQFNSQFTTYEDKVGNTWTIYDVITISGYAKENNVYYSDLPEYQVQVFLGNENLANTITDLRKKELIQNDQSAIGVDGNIKLPTYKCDILEYHENGRIYKIKFYK